LAFTPAKNAAKPNPFKIIPLQPTRKENSWETEETMASNCNSGDGTGQMAQPWMFMMMMMMMMIIIIIITHIVHICITQYAKP
jgi:hypothetical protein